MLDDEDIIANFIRIRSHIKSNWSRDKKLSKIESFIYFPGLRNNHCNHDKRKLDKRKGLINYKAKLLRETRRKSIGKCKGRSVKRYGLLHRSTLIETDSQKQLSKQFKIYFNDDDT